MRILLRILVAGLTFCIGLLSSASAKLPMTLLVSLVFFFGFPVIIGAIVVYRGALAKRQWRPAIGKGFLAVFLWLFPSPFLLVVNLLAAFEPMGQQGVEPLTFPFNVTVVILTAAYGLVGFALCIWVWRPDKENHWLLRSSQ